ncbi:hypothetical protein VTJ49DRAFT_973 [Mycothermus thermophilus]|uniref:DNA/RNA-binding protein Alba-like domain-containing protein n=1 Tax=Humicola insolens TaxID=85995 RepID=A0ABR3VE46_HUMIN
MATSTAQMKPSDPFPMAPFQGGKRKLPSDTSAEPISNKRQAAGRQLETQAEELRAHNSTTSQPPSSGNNSPYTQIYRPFIDRLSSNFDVKPMSVMPSTSIRGHVDRALSHLGRFSPWDLSIRPGVVVLCAKSPAASKLVTIAELVRRRIGESEQKWYQYNVVSETVTIEEAGVQMWREPPSVVEDTVMGGEAEEGEEEEDGEYFETMTRPTTIHDEAVHPPRTRYTAYVTVLLSRVPVAELQSDPCIAVQTNEQTIEYLRKKKMGLVG